MLHPVFLPNTRRIVQGLVLPLLCALTLLPGRARAQSQAEAGQSAWSVRGWRSDSGLPVDEDYDIAQSTDGSIWVATSQGMFRFDGIHFTAVIPPEVGRDFSSIVYAICAARDGSVWWALSHGRVVRWQNGYATIWGTANGMPNDFPCSICEGRKGAIFVGFRKAGVVEIAGGKATRFSPSTGVPDQTRGALASDSDGNVWCAAATSLLEFRDGAFVPVADIPQGQSPTEGLETAANGGFWLRGDHDVRHLVIGKGIDRTIPVPQTLGFISSIHDDGHNLWIGTMQSPQCGLYWVQGDQLVSEGLERRQVTSIINDREGNIWLTTFEDGIKRLQPRLLRFLKVDPGLLTWGRIRSFAQDASGAVWAVFEDNTVFCLENGKLEQVPQFSQNSGAAGRAIAVEPGPGNSMYIGTWDHGVFRCDNPQSAPVSVRLSSQFEHVMAMLSTQTGDLWVSASHANVARIRKGHASVFSNPDGGTAPLLASNAGDDILMAISRGQIYHIANEKITELPFPGAGDYPVHGLWRDDEGNIWIGFLGGGLGRLKDGKFARATVEDGLADDYIYQVLPDEMGRIWTISNTGLSRIDVADFDRFASGQTKRLRITTFQQEEKDLDSEAPTRNVGFSAGYCCRVFGNELWFSYGNGILIVNPQARALNNTPPPVAIEEVRVDGRDIPLDPASLKHVTLPPSHSRLEFDYVALSFDMPENNQYRYMLEGYDKQWNDAGTDRHATYSRLTAGKYRFRVIACNSDGIWNDAGASVAFTVAPFFWQTWWFQLTVLAIIIVCVVVIVRFVSYRRLRSRLRLSEQQAALHRERSRIARDMHDELGASLTRITLMSELASGEPGLPANATDNLSAIANASRAVSGTLDQIVWTVNPRNDTLERLIGYAGEFAGEYLGNVGINLRLELPREIPARSVSSDARHQVLLVVKEALNNVAKYAGARQVTMHVAFDNGTTQIRIADDGIGFDPGAVSGTANGLRNMRQRAASLGGAADIESQPGGGTTVTFTAPL